jgi:hypothetical protein
MSAEMELDNEVQEIDPPVIIRSGRKKYQKKILNEELDVHFCRRSKRHSNNVESCQDQDGIDSTNVSEETSNNANLDSFENLMEQNVASEISLFSFF